MVIEAKGVRTDEFAASAVEKQKRDRLDLESPRFERALSYTHTFQRETVRTQPEDDKERGLIGLGECRFLVPNKDRFNMLFYWDSYFMMQPLKHTEEGRDLARSTIEAFAKLLDRYGMIPNASAMTYLGNSQAPLYSSMILDTYTATPAADQNPSWLEHYMDYAKYEYHHVWNNEKDYENDGIGSFHHYLPEYGLSKYGDRDGDYSLNAERESGWDFTSRFGNVAIDYLPIDLNCFLYKYETDFAKAADILGREDEKNFWLEKSEQRKQKINELMWSDFFFDYNFRTKKQSPFYSLASYTALWTGLATPEQALKMLDEIPRFDKGKGLMVTDKESLPQPLSEEDVQNIDEHYRERIIRSMGRREELTPEEIASDVVTGKQWDYPHVWAPLEYMTVVGLLAYAKDARLTPSEQTRFRDKAKELMEDYLVTTMEIFEETEPGSFPEKSNGVTGKEGNGAHYWKQSGFGWTCAAFQEFAERLLPDLYNDEAISFLPNRRMVS